MAGGGIVATRMPASAASRICAPLELAHRLSAPGRQASSVRSARALLPTAPGLKDDVFNKDDVRKDNLVKVTQRFKEWQLAGRPPQLLLGRQSMARVMQCC